MPRDSNGNFSLDPVYQATPGQTIRAVQHNTPLQDIATALTGSIARSGAGGMLGNLNLNGFKATNLLDGTNPGDAATIGQVSDIAAGVAEEIIEEAVVPATETEKGIVEKATPDEVRSAAPDKYIAADLIETASAMVTLTDAATVAIDWDAFINAEVTLSANRALGNPTNGQPGTYRTILVKGDGGTARTLTFGNQYLGDIPVINNATSVFWHLITLRCITPTHFVVGSQVARSS